MNCLKTNPSRVFTPEGQASWGGSRMEIYSVESSGGYMPTRLAIPDVDILGSKKGYSVEKPWLFENQWSQQAVQKAWPDVQARSGRGGRPGLVGLCGAA